jgi:two-component system phosphate regulon sensor histidine kinase PhoR
MKIKLHWKLTFIFCLAFIAGLLAGFLYLARHLESYVEADLENHLKHELFLGRDFLQTKLNDQGVLTDAKGFADRLGKALDVRATIVNQDGVVLGDSDLSPVQIAKVENHRDRPEIRDAAKQGFGTSRRYSYSVRKDLLYEAISFGNGSSGGILRFAVPISSIEILERRLQKIIFFALGLVFVLGLAFTYLISLIVSKPLTEMSKIAQEMARGNYSRKPFIHSSDEIGDLARALSHLSDQIQEKIKEIKLEAVKRDAILSGMFEGIIAVDEKGTISLANPAIRKLFFIESDLEGKKPIEAIRNVAIQEMIDAILKNGGGVMSDEIHLSVPDERILRVSGAPVTREGALKGAVLVFHDITEFKRLEKVRQDFVANVSHELRTPISSIKGYAETLLEGAMKDKEHLKDFLKIIHEDANRLAVLIEDLLDLSKIESGKMAMEFAPLDLEPFLKRTSGVLDQFIKEKALSLTLDIPATLPKLLTDEKSLGQVLLNLLDNAVKYTPKGGKIRVSAVKSNERMIQIDVEDTGIGIPEKDIPRIFERFYRVDKGRSRELGGTGLGLSIVKHIVMAHGGEIWVKSSPGQGSTFSFTIPQA